MFAPLKMLKTNFPYAYIAVGVIWLVVAIATSSFLLLWPVVACVVGGALLKLRPSQRLTWAWATAAIIMGLALASYQAYKAATLVTGSFATIAGASLVVFVIFALAHLVLLYVGNASSAEG